jgi:hypothetical protein
MCGATTGGVSLDGVNVAKESVIQGVVTAEVPTSATGHFRFFAAPGEWTLRTLAPKADVVDNKVVAQQGVVAEVAVSL